jgi:hypothetical protein
MRLMYEMKVCSRRNWLEPNFNIENTQPGPHFAEQRWKNVHNTQPKQQETSFICLEQGTV